MRSVKSVKIYLYYFCLSLIRLNLTCHIAIGRGVRRARVRTGNNGDRFSLTSLTRLTDLDWRYWGARPRFGCA
jgi:hypothetical protein